MTAAPYALRLAFRELRGGVRGFRIFLACLVLGVGAIAAIGSLGAAVGAAIHDDARVLFGGDAAARLVHREASPAERQFLDRSGAVSEVALLQSMAVSPDRAKHTLIELKAVDAAYPLYGGVQLNSLQSVDSRSRNFNRPGQPSPQPSPVAPGEGEPRSGWEGAGANSTISLKSNLASALARHDGVYGAAVDPAVAARLGLRIGDRFKIGTAQFDLRATIERVPDAALSGLAFGPTVIVAMAALPGTGLLKPGALVNYDYRVKLPPGSDPAVWVRRARDKFPNAGWQVRTAGEASPALQRFIDRIGLFLGLVGITALLVGGIGIASAVAYFVPAKTATIATLKSLGASTRLVFVTYAAQIAILALAGIAAGLVLGALAPAAVAPFIAGLLPVPLRVGPHPLPLAVAAADGVLATVMFALLPLARIGQVAAGALFRDLIVPARRHLPLAALAGTAVAGLALAALLVVTATDRAVAIWYVAGAIISFAVFRLAGEAIVAAARRVGRPRRIVLRLALANLHRPGAPTPRVVLSLGIGLTVLVAVALVQASLSSEIEGSIAEGAPAYFFLDIQPGQLAGFEAMVQAIPGSRMEETPMLRGRITRLNGVPVENAAVAPDARWALNSDRGLTYAAELPTGSQIVAGKWWAADYKGPPLISFDAGLARGMGLKIGDTLTVNVLGREVTATIANLRSIDWTRLGINFAIVFAPGTLEAAPHTVLAATWLPPEADERLVGEVVDQDPNVSAIPVRQALDAVERIIAAIGAAIRLAALVTLVAGALVLGGAVAADYRRRVYEAVVLKVLGATRGTIAAAFLVEYGLMGAVGAVIAAALGTGIAYLLVTGPLRADWIFAPWPLVVVLAGAVGLTMALGFAGTWKVLGAPAAAELRHE